MRATSSGMLLGIGEVERDTGISKDTLRIWERRYGFPNPVRDTKGERLYDAGELEQLRLIRRLLDSGKRPGKIVGRPLSELQKLGAGHLQVRSEVRSATHENILDTLKAHDGLALQQQLSQLRMRHGLKEFVGLLDSMTTLVGDAWAAGTITTYDEHLYTEAVHSVLRVVLHGMRQGNWRPRVLLTTLPQEHHGLGLLMVEALLVAENVRCISLGTQTPATDIVGAAAAHRVDIVGVSFSQSFPLRLATTCIQQLRTALPPSIDLWIGGRATVRLGALPSGVTRIESLDGLLPALAAWRQSR